MDLWAIEPRMYAEIPARKTEYRNKAELKRDLMKILTGDYVMMYESIMIWKGKRLIRRVTNFNYERQVIGAFREYPMARIDLAALRTRELKRKRARRIRTTKTNHTNDEARTWVTRLPLLAEMTNLKAHERPENSF